jgi:hypothetical protein
MSEVRTKLGRRDRCQRPVRRSAPWQPAIQNDRGASVDACGGTSGFTTPAAGSPRSDGCRRSTSTASATVSTTSARSSTCAVSACSRRNTSSMRVHRPNGSVCAPGAPVHGPRERQRRCTTYWSYSSRSTTCSRSGANGCLVIQRHARRSHLCALSSRPRSTRSSRSPSSRISSGPSSSPHAGTRPVGVWSGLPADRGA